MKVLHVITGLKSGGAETQLEMLVGRSRHEAEVCALYNADGAVGRRISEAGVPVHDLTMRSNMQLGKVLELARLMRRGRYDAVHLHLYRATVYGRVAARLAGVPLVVTTEHSLGESRIEGRPKGGSVRALYLATERFSDATVAVSPRVKERLVEWGVEEGKIIEVPNGLDFSRYEPTPEADPGETRRDLGLHAEAFVAGSVGRLHPGKGLDLLLGAFARAFSGGSTPKGEPAYLLLVGDGPDRARLAELAKHLGLRSRVVFAGERSDVPAVLRALDLFVSPSSEETFGLSILEAVAASRPVLAGACPALDALGEEAARATKVGRLRDDDAGDDRAEDVRLALLDASFERFPASVPTEALKRAYDADEIAAALDGLLDGAADAPRPRALSMQHAGIL